MIGTVLDHLWQSSLVALLIGALTLLFRNNSASVRHGLWFVASLKFLLPFSLLTFFGHSIFTHTVPDSSIRALAKIESVTVPFATGTPILIQTGPPHFFWIVIAGAIWVFGFSAIVAVWLVQWARLERIGRSAMHVPSSAPIPVRITSELLEPGLVGIMRPIILLPDVMAQRLAQADIEAIIAHELCHLRRNDNLLALIHMLVEAVFWFHPLVWFIGARLVEERERACDDNVLDTGQKPLAYAQTILKVCRLTFCSRLPCASGISGADLDRRIRTIMTERRIDDLDPNKILLLAGLSLFAVITPFVTGGLVPAQNVRTLQSLVQVFADRQQVVQPVTVATHKFRAARHRSVHHLKSVSVPPPTIISAPRIYAEMPLVILPEPQLSAESNTSTAEDTDRLVCRPPERLPDSQLMGPQVCLSKQTWDNYKARGLVLMPDGWTVMPSFQQLRRSSPVVCLGTGFGASNATSWTATCRL